MTVTVILALTTQPAAISPYFDPALLALKSCGPGTEPQSTLSGFEAAWYSKALSAAQEPALYKRSLSKQSGKAFRFTWLGSFDHPVTVRVEFQADGRAYLVAKELSGLGGYEPGHVSRKMERVLSEREMVAFRKEVADSKIFAVSSSHCQGMGTDGGQWIFEATDGRSYQFAQAWSPIRGSAHDLGLAFLRMTSWGVKPY